MEVYGICAGCGQDRMLPGIGPAGQRWCTHCAGGLGDFTCTRCGREGWRGRRDTCGWCVLRDRVSELMDDGTGRIRPELAALAEHIIAMPRPRSGIHWLSRPGPGRVLAAMARGQVPLTHEGIHTLQPVRSSIYIRDLMVAAGILPPVDRRLFLFEQWWPTWLAQIPHPEHRTTLRYFLTWQVLRTLRTAADDGPLSHQGPQRARHVLRVAATFLADLPAHDRTLDTCTQADLDRVLAGANLSTKATLRPFLQWAMRTNRMPTLPLPAHVERPVNLITQDQRLALIRRIHHGQDMAPIDRVLALFVLLYAQPLARIQHLRVDDITFDGTGQMLVRLGDPPAPVPAPFDTLITDYLTARTNVMTATNPDSPWLFPGRRAGQPLQINSMRLRLTNLGIPNLPARSRAIRELLRQAPPAVVAGMLAYTPIAAEKIATEYGATWKHYTRPDHPPRQPPHLQR
jgi:integrase